MKLTFFYRNIIKTEIIKGNKRIGKTLKEKFPYMHDITINSLLESYFLQCPRFYGKKGFYGN